MDGCIILVHVTELSNLARRSAMRTSSTTRYNTWYTVPNDDSGNPIPVADSAHPEWNSTFNDPTITTERTAENIRRSPTGASCGAGWNRNKSQLVFNGGPGAEFE